MYGQQCMRQDAKNTPELFYPSSIQFNCKSMMHSSEDFRSVPVKRLAKKLGYSSHLVSTKQAMGYQKDIVLGKSFSWLTTLPF